VSQGIPVITLTFLPFALQGLDGTFGPLIAWNVGIQSCLAHKEFRFMGPMLPLFLISTGKSLLNFKRRSKLIWIGLALTQGLIGFYLSRFHQRGVVDVTLYLRKEALQGRVESIYFMMPCHSTPFYSHVHADVPMDFIKCDPPWK
jgi:phosphatidylinositol glycan class B